MSRNTILWIRLGLICFVFLAGCNRSRKNDDDTGQGSKEDDSQSGSLRWVMGLGGNDGSAEDGIWCLSEIGQAVTSFDDGSFLVGGTFVGQATFGKGQEQEKTLTTLEMAEGNPWSEDIFVARYDEDATLQWVVQIGSPISIDSNIDTLMSLAVHSDGSWSLLGDSGGTLTVLDADNQTTTIEHQNGSFLARFSANGAFQWGVDSGGSCLPARFASAPCEMAGDRDGSVYVLGQFHNKETFGKGQPTEITLNATSNEDSDSGTDGFLAKYNKHGKFEWVRQIGGPQLEEARDIAVAPNGMIYLRANFEDSVIFDTNGESFELTKSGPQMFLASYTPDGEFEWAVAVWKIYIDDAGGMAVMSDGTIVLTGSVSGKATFGPGESAETQVKPHGTVDVFVARYRPDSTLIDVFLEGGPKASYATDVKVLGDQSFVVTGYFTDEITFGRSQKNQTTLRVDDCGYERCQDIFVAQYAPDGELIWAKRYGGYSFASNRGNGIAELTDGTVVVVGEFESPGVFDMDNPDKATLETTGNYDIFVMGLQN